MGKHTREIDHEAPAMKAASLAVAERLRSTNAPVSIARAALDAYMDHPEQVEVSVTTSDVARLAHLLVQLSPATPRNSAATVRRLLYELNITEVEQ